MLGEREPVENALEERQMLNLVYRDYLLCSQSCLTLCDPMDCSTPGFPDTHYLQEFAHVHWVDDAIQPSHLLLLSSPSSPALSLSQHQGLFQWVGSSHQAARVSASVLPMSILGWFPLGLIGLVSLLCEGFLGAVKLEKTIQRVESLGGSDTCLMSTLFECPQSRVHKEAAAPSRSFLL